ncbi:MAG: DUF3667 domain-containing protein [Saprospiraceae bacterium]|nr:DUF3667 domain-containing protein [Saprospiraceae bacterium]
MENQCPNCHAEIRPESNFCSVCGQKNESLFITSRQLVTDFLTNVFAWDNRFLRSIRELARPASLTVQFFSGARQQFIPPARLYLFTVLLHLAVISYFSTGSFFFSDRDRTTGKELVKLHDQIATIEAIQDTILLNDSLSITQRDALDRLHTHLKDKYDGLNDTIRFFLFEDDPLNAFTLYDLEAAPKDSLAVRMSKKPWHYQLIGNQFVKTYRDPKALGTFLFARLSWMMFLILPFVGLILAGLYYRQKRYFVEHLVFALHYHVAAFLLVSLGLIGDYLINGGWTTIAVVLSLAYIYIAMKRYYQQSWTRTFGKFIILHIMYFLVCVTLISLLLISSFLLFA